MFSRFVYIKPLYAPILQSGFWNRFWVQHSRNGQKAYEKALFRALRVRLQGKGISFGPHITSLWNRLFDIAYRCCSVWIKKNSSLLEIRWWILSQVNESERCLFSFFFSISDPGDSEEKIRVLQQSRTYIGMTFYSRCSKLYRRLLEAQAAKLGQTSCTLLEG